MESHRDQLARVKGMADAGDTWDLSENDCIALNAVLDERHTLLEALQEILTAIELEGANGLRFFEARNSGLAALQKAEGRP